MNMLWPDSLLPLARGGTHPAADAAPLPRGDMCSSPNAVPLPRRDVLLPSLEGWPEGPGWVPCCVILPILLAIALVGAGCAVVPLSRHQTLPPTRMALSSLEGAQRSLDDIRTDYENSLETAPAERPVAAYGATHGAYQRWVTDEVRELPSVSQTIAIGGGDT